MKKLLITNPDHDNITHYLFKWNEGLEKLAQERGFQVSHMKTAQVTRKNVIGFLEKINPELAILHGHGTSSEIYGYGKDEILIKEGDNESALKGKIVHSVACSSASELGLAAVEKGCRAFIGFSEKFWLFYSDDMTADPLNDLTARPFMEPLARLSEGLVKGKSAKRAYQDSQRCFRDWLEVCQKSDAPFELEGLAPFIAWDMSNQTFHGDGESKA